MRVRNEAAGARRPLVAGNWKMHLLGAEAERLCHAIRRALGAGVPGRVELALFPSFPLLSSVAEALAGSGIGFGGQDLHTEDQGAFTGDVSGRQLADAGANWVLCGHSERRLHHGESDEQVARKVAAAGRAGLRPLVCIGETGEQRRAGETFAILERQLVSLPEAAGMVLAYEPVWAIGSGETATPEVAEEAHRFVRSVWERRFAGSGEKMRILYGGSVTPDNSMGLAAMPDIDGALIGGASLDPGKFLAIISSFAA